MRVHTFYNTHRQFFIVIGPEKMTRVVRLASSEGVSKCNDSKIFGKEEKHVDTKTCMFSSLQCRFEKTVGVFGNGSE